jgi:hypothetical protein
MFVRPSANGLLGFPIHIIRSVDNVWRIDSM